MKKNLCRIIPLLFISFFAAAYAAAHCEIPCGIYDDEMRIQMISEHIATIEKAMKQISKLQSVQPVDYNQLVRWISNKEHHADEIQQIVSQYFMTQRIKFSTVKYSEKLVLLHKMLVYAMKCKQTNDLSHTEALHNLLKGFHSLYFSPEK